MERGRDSEGGASERYRSEATKEKRKDDAGSECGRGKVASSGKGKETLKEGKKIPLSNTPYI